MSAEPLIPVPPAAEHPGSRPADYCHCGHPVPCRIHSDRAQAVAPKDKT